MSKVHAAKKVYLHYLLQRLQVGNFFKLGPHGYAGVIN